MTCVLIAEKDGLLMSILALERRSMDEREAANASALPQLIALAKEKTEHYQQSLADIDPADITSPMALATLPVLRKSTLIQEDCQPLAVEKVIPHDFGETHQIFQSPGPIFEIGMRKKDWWRFGRALAPIGIGKGDIIQNCFSITSRRPDRCLKRCGCGGGSYQPGQARLNCRPNPLPH